MTTCSEKHPVNALCTDRNCYLGDRNPYYRLQRRLDRSLGELQRVRQYVVKKLTRAETA